VTPRTPSLFEAFREDHAILGRGFHELSALLRAGDLPAARERAERLDREAGAHMAFEEQHFYPALRGLIGDTEVDRLHGEHEQGIEVVRALRALPEGGSLEPNQRRALLARSELMESHVAECGELFGTLGRIPPQEQAGLYDRLLELRARQPRWTGMAAGEAEDHGNR